jgi:hypothetical protein
MLSFGIAHGAGFMDLFASEADVFDRRRELWIKVAP